MFINRVDGDQRSPQRRFALAKPCSIWRTVDRFMVVVLTILSVCVAQMSSWAAEERQVEQADSVLFGGKILTVDAADRMIEALAIREGRIMAVGTDAEIGRLVGDRTKVIHLEGKTVIPGIIETHCHAIGVGHAAMEQPYAELSSIPEIQAWIRARAQQLPHGRWIQVPRTDLTRLKERRHPTPAELDEACDTHPIFFNAARKNVLNSLALSTIGIDGQTKSISGGQILRDSDGRVLMISGADSYLRQFLPRREFTEAETLAALRQVHKRYNEVGITSIFERASDREGYRLYEELRDQGELTVRTTITVRQPFRSGADVEQFSRSLGLKTGDGDGWVRVGPLKITVDGGIHWGNTYLREPYGERRIGFYRLSDPHYRGDRHYSVEQMKSIFATGHRLGWQMCCHVTGDAGVDAVLEALAAVNAEQQITDRRFTLIHSYFPTAEAVELGRSLGICVDTQPYLYYKDSAAINEIYGKRWAERFIGLQDWLRGGIPVAINSDHMIGLDPDHAMNSFNPFLQMYIAVSRKNENGQVYGKRQRLSRVEALRSMTTSAAHLSFDEQNKGSLQIGMYADLAVLDRDYLTCPVDEIRSIKVMLTMVDGRVVYRR